MIQQVIWKSRKALPCDRCPPVAAIICVTSSLIAQKPCPVNPVALPELTEDTSFPWQTILGIVVSVTTMGEGCGQWFLFTITYDDSQLVPGNTLDPDDVHGVVCDDTCLTSWIREQIGNDVKLEFSDDDPPVLQLINQHGCAFEILTGNGGGGVDFSVTGDDGTPRSVADGGVVSILGSDTISTTSSAPSTVTIEVDISADSGNILESHADGLYVPPRTVTFVDNGDGTFDFFQDGDLIGTLNTCIYCGGGGPLAPLFLSEGFNDAGICESTASWSLDTFNDPEYLAFVPPQPHYVTVPGPNGTDVCARNYITRAYGSPADFYINHLQSGLPLSTRKVYVVEESFIDPFGGFGQSSGEHLTYIIVQGVSPNSAEITLRSYLNTTLNVQVVDQATSVVVLNHSITIPDQQNIWSRIGLYVQLNSTPVTADGFVQVYLNGGPSNPNPIYDSGLMILTTGTGDLTLTDEGQRLQSSGGIIGGEYLRYVSFINIYNGTPGVTQL